VSKNENLKPFAIDAGKASVALAVASLCAGVATAATVNKAGTQGKLSLEVIKASAGYATGGSTFSTSLATMTMTLGATYTGGDSLTLTIGGASFADVYANVICDGTSFLSFSKAASTQVFRVPGTGTFTTGSACEINSARILNSSVTAEGTITLLPTGATSGGVAFDNSAAASKVATVVNAYKVSVASTGKLDGLVDAKYGNKQFKSGSTQDVLTLTFTSTSVDNTATYMGGLTGSATVAATIDVLGDFTFLVNGTETTSSDILTSGSNSAAASAGSLSIIGSSAAVTGLRLKLESANVPANGSTATITLTGSSVGNKLTTQTFSTSPYTLQIQTPEATSTSYSITGTYEPGVWSQVGTQVFVPYMPVGSTINQVLYIANNSSTAGVATMSARSTSGGTCTTAAVTIAANANTNLSDALAAAIASCQAAGTVAATDKLFITVTATSPLASTEVYSSFTVGGTSRVTLPNSSNGYKGNGATVIGGSNADNSL